MNDKILDSVIAASRDRPIPKVPQDLEADVMRCIRNGAVDRARDAAGWLDLLLAPRTAAALSAIVLITTLGVATATTLSNTRPERRELAAQTLDFTTFAPSVVFEFSE